MPPTQPPTDPLIEIRDLKTHFFTEDGVVKAVDGIDLDIHANRTLVILGQSGSGKSIMARSILRIVDAPGRIVGGSILYRAADGRSVDLATARPGSRALRDIRGQDISMIFQEPMSSLGPITKVGKQITETILLHRDVTKQEAREQAIDLLDRVGIPDPTSRYESYPFELSGGMRQRVMIAMALSCQPRLLIADEPTTALDVTTQAQILDLIAELREAYQMGVMLITHDMGVAAQVADDISVMYHGKVAEQGDVFSIFDAPRHPYTQALLASVPRIGGARLHRLPDIAEFLANPENPPAPIPARPREPARDVALSVRDVKVHFTKQGGMFSCGGETVKAVDGVSFDVMRGETFGIVGESGSGKSTISRAIMGIVEPTAGQMTFYRDGKPDIEISGADKGTKREMWRDMRMVFQDPQASLNPRLRVIDLVGQCIQKAEGLGRAAIAERVSKLLRQVGLSPDYLLRYPNAFSGGQRQRLGVARALATRPQLVIADEAVSALDVPIQAQVLNLLQDLQEEFALTYIFISHDLAVVDHICDRVAVMYKGKMVELLTREELARGPKHPYTKELLAASPVADPRRARRVATPA